MMNLRQLECFSVLADELNFTRAAEKLHMAQPPLSRQVKLLEETLGVTLFERTKRSVKLTPQGVYLRKEVLETFRHLRHVKASLRQIQNGESGLISIGYVGAAMHAVLPDLLKKFLKKYKNVNVHLHEMDNNQQLEALKKGIIDIGFLRSHIEGDGIELLKVHEEPFALVVPASIKLRSANLADLKILRDMPFIGFPSACAPTMVKSIFAILNRLKLNPRQIHESSQINSIVRIVESGIGYTILPGSVKDVYKLGVRTYDLSRHSDRAMLYMGINKVRRSPLVKNILSLIDP